VACGKRDARNLGDPWSSRAPKQRWPGRKGQRNGGLSDGGMGVRPLHSTPRRESRSHAFAIASAMRGMGKAVAEMRSPQRKHEQKECLNRTCKPHCGE